MKRYLEPKIEVLPVSGVTALCTSGEDKVTTANGGGGSQGDLGRAPRRTPVF